MDCSSNRREICASSRIRQNRYAVAVLDRQVLAQQFSPRRLDSDDVWDLLPRVTARHRLEYDTAGPIGRGQTEVRIALTGGRQLQGSQFAARSAIEPLSREEIVEKFTSLTVGIVEAPRQHAIVDLVTNFEQCPDLIEIRDLLAGSVGSPFDDL
jgi:2-methylcitrate dehydratase PrpD